jgi:hypothetical protein
MGAIQFIENMDRTSLTITDDEFEQNVEAAVSAIAEKHGTISPIISHQAQFSEKFAHRTEGIGGRLSVDTGEGIPRRSTSMDGDPTSEGQAISGILKTIQKPLTSIGRMFSDDAGPSSSSGADGAQAATGQALQTPSGPGGDSGSRPSSRHTLSAEEAAARQASAETAEAQRLQRAEHANVVETLAGMFPDLDRDVISDVVYEKEGRQVNNPHTPLFHRVSSTFMTIKSRPSSFLRNFISGPDERLTLFSKQGRVGRRCVPCIVFIASSDAFSAFFEVDAGIEIKIKIEFETELDCP